MSRASPGEMEPRCSPRTPKPKLRPDYEESGGRSSTGHESKRVRKSAKNETSVEDIYLNKLWKKQMPKDKIWETIFEAPKFTRWGTLEYMSKRRQKRYVNFEDLYLTNRLKRRQRKALKMGWKPLSKRSDTIAAAKLKDKLQSLDRDISEVDEMALCTPEAAGDIPATMYVDLASSKTSQQATTEDEDTLYAPSSSNLGQFEDVSTNESTSLSSADVSGSPLQTFGTPPVGEELKSFPVSSRSKTQDDSQHCQQPLMQMNLYAYTMSQEPQSASMFPHLKEIAQAIRNAHHNISQEELQQRLEYYMRLEIKCQQEVYQHQQQAHMQQGEEVTTQVPLWVKD